MKPLWSLFYIVYGCNLCGHFTLSESCLWTFIVKFHVWFRSVSPRHLRPKDILLEVSDGNPLPQATIQPTATPPPSPAADAHPLPPLTPPPAPGTPTQTCPALRPQRTNRPNSLFHGDMWDLSTLVEDFPTLTSRQVVEMLRFMATRLEG